MQDRPTVSELLEAVSEFLERDVMTQEGRLGFHGRVARNAIRIVRRELALGPEADQREQDGLRELLGDDTADDLRAANAELARRIRDGLLDDQREELITHLRRTAVDKLRIANPRELEEQG